MELPQLRWACRRGMLELDLIFEAYVNKHYSEASKEEQESFQRLLDSHDQELFDWLVKRQTCPPQHTQMVKILLEHTIHD
ncbi:MAG: succinate dehydrogenase assembly factor 2 [Gammaproteobacteria bacterium]|nr:succinate dehydrogenase assembly factor 2 [Gammaproteobacteria bacterium]